VKQVPRPRAPRAPLFDRMIAGVAPGWAASRATSRRVLAQETARAALVASASGWAAARQDRAALRGWNPRPRTADEDTLPKLPDLRARAREQHMNNPLARGAVQTVTTSVVGTGLRLVAQADREALKSEGLDDTAIDAAERQMEREWRLFTAGTGADAHRRLTWTQTEELALASQLVDGDCFAAFVAAPAPGAFDLAVQLVEAGAVSNPRYGANTPTLSDGLEYAADGTPVAIHVAEIPRNGPSVASAWRRMPLRAEDGTPRVLHLIRPDRIGQSRGVPYLAPVLAALKELDTYAEAELRAAVMNACVALIGQSTDGGSPLAAEASAAAGGASAATSGGLVRADIEFEPGMVIEGFAPGEAVEGFGSERPSTGFDPFVQAILRQIGVGLELPFEVLIKHFTASYSAARAALLEAWKFFRVRRAWLAAALHQPTYEMVIANAVLRGRLDLPGWQDPVLRAAWLQAVWMGIAPPQLDPVKEVTAAEKRIALRISTRAREAAELTGEAFEPTAATAAREEDLLRRLKLTEPPHTPDASPDPPPDPDNPP
jgi:lambda family phage portal protein